MSDDARDAKPPEAKPRRHLPIVGAEKPGSGVAEEADTEPRPPWHWVAIGVLVAFAVWLPLAFVVGAVLPEHTRSPADTSASGLVLAIGSHVAAFATGCAAGAAVAGRFGAGLRVRETALVGALTAALAWLISASQGTAAGGLVWGLLLVLLVAIGAGAATGGGKLGIRLRAPQK